MLVSIWIGGSRLHYLCQHEDEPADKLSNHDQQLIDDLLSIHGVISIQTGNYRIGIERGPVFDWKEITPRVESVVAHWAGLEPPTPQKQPWHQRLRKLFTKRG